MRGAFSSYSSNDLDSTKAKKPPADEAWSALGEFSEYVIHAWAAMLYAFARRSFGRHFFNRWGMGGILVLSFWACVSTPPEQAFPVTVMMAVFVMLTLFHRSQSRKGLDGVIQHTRYNGWPRICDVLPVSEQFAKSILEPGVIAMVGYGIQPLFN